MAKGDNPSLPHPIVIDSPSSSLRSVTADMDEVAIATVCRLSADAVQRTPTEMLAGGATA